ncbi:MAG TPA: aminotransferase class I/II-fold pyridoxal phosphate-dependent enzyme, partial [Steroidobacteraceae bacterium]|nr:aminotransferase class I/II-fold pyridoxal phosphate-dependent enzyme [Steroidobacteraceae bacterium]
SLIQRGRTYIYTTAPPPAVAAATRAALRVIEREPERRERVLANVRSFRAGAAAAGLRLMPSDTPIQPVLAGHEASALAASEALFEAGLWVPAIRPPTVPAGTSRLRVTFSASHTEAQVAQLLAALGELRARGLLA